MHAERADPVVAAQGRSATYFIRTALLMPCRCTSVSAPQPRLLPPSLCTAERRGKYCVDAYEINIEAREFDMKCPGVKTQTRMLTYAQSVPGAAAATAGLGGMHACMRARHSHGPGPVPVVHTCLGPARYRGIWRTDMSRWK